MQQINVCLSNFIHYKQNIITKAMIKYQLDVFYHGFYMLVLFNWKVTKNIL